MSPSNGASHAADGQRTRKRLGWKVGGVAVASLAFVVACNDSITSTPQVGQPEANAVASSNSLTSGEIASKPRVNAIPAAADCPPQFFVTGINLAKNPSFETGPGPQTWPPGPTPPPSAAKGWFMHTDNFNAKVSSSLVATNVPGPGGLRMLSFQTGGAEGGVYQVLPSAPSRVMFSVWVKVSKGLVTIGANTTTGMTPTSSSTKLNEWEQLRVCTDGTFPTGYFFILNEAVGGGAFVADRVEIKQIP